MEFELMVQELLVMNIQSSFFFLFFGQSIKQTWILINITFACIYMYQKYWFYSLNAKLGKTHRSRSSTAAASLPSLPVCAAGTLPPASCPETPWTGWGRSHTWGSFRISRCLRGRLSLPQPSGRSAVAFPSFLYRLRILTYNTCIQYIQVRQNSVKGISIKYNNSFLITLPYMYVVYLYIFVYIYMYINICLREEVWGGQILNYE